MSFSDFLHAFGIDMPTPLYLVGVLLFGFVGLAAWRHGRKAARPRPKWLGLALMLYPYVTPQTWLMYLVGSLLCTAVYFTWD